MGERAGSTILITESRLLLRRRICPSLRREGFLTLEASSPEQALHLARICRPDLVLVDIDCDASPSLDLARRIRRATGRQTRIVAYSRTCSELLRAIITVSGYDDWEPLGNVAVSSCEVARRHLPLRSGRYSFVRSSAA
jgi:DNA-binding response OmpR family regulator